MDRRVVSDRSVLPYGRIRRGDGCVGKVVLVTGTARQLGAALVHRLQHEPGVERVVGVDTVPPTDSHPDVEFVRTDIRQPGIGAVLSHHAVDTVVHTDLHSTPRSPRGSRSTVKETNVIGTMQLLGGCQKVPTMRRLVVASSTAVYGSAPRDPAVCEEGTPAKALPRGGFAKDMVEVEGYVRGFARRRPDVSVTVLRFAHVLGPGVDSPMAAYFSLPVLPTALGYDPRLQFVHVTDALEALCAASGEPSRGTLNAGTFNIAGSGVLLLSQCARRLGRPTLPLPPPALRWGGSALRSLGVPDFPPEQVRLLVHGRVVRTTRMREVLGFEPRYSTEQALAAVATGPALLPPDRLARAVDGLASRVVTDTSSQASSSRTSYGQRHDERPGSSSAGTVRTEKGARLDG